MRFMQPTVVRLTTSLIVAWECIFVPESILGKDRLPVPNASDNTREDYKLRDQFRKQFREAETTRLKLDALDKRLQRTRNQAKSPTTEYLLLRSARDLAAEADDAVLVEEVVNRLADRFDVDRDRELQNAFRAMMAGSPRPKTHEKICVCATRHAKELSDQRQFAAATAWAEFGLAVVQAGGDAATIQRLRELHKNLQAIGGAPDREIIPSGAVNGALVTSVLDCSTRSYQLEVDRQFDCNRSWTLKLEFGGTALTADRRDIVYCRSGLGRGPILIRVTGNQIEARVQDARFQKNLSLTAEWAPASSDSWTAIMFRYDSRDGDLLLFVDGKLKQRAKATVQPFADQPLVMGIGVESDVAAPFHGKIRAVSLGNAEDFSR